MSQNRKSNLPEYRWTERRADLSAERQYLTRRLEAVNQLLTLVRIQESKQVQIKDGQKQR